MAVVCKSEPAGHPSFYLVATFVRRVSSVRLKSVKFPSGKRATCRTLSLILSRAGPVRERRCLQLFVTLLSRGKWASAFVSRRRSARPPLSFTLSANRGPYVRRVVSRRLGRTPRPAIPSCKGTPKVEWD